MLSVLPMAQNQRIKYSLQERVFLLKNYYKFDGDREVITQLFSNNFPDSCVPGRNYLQTGSIADAPHQGAPCTFHTEENANLVAQTYALNPHQSAKRTAMQMGNTRRSLHRIMKEIGLNVYRPVLLQELRESDYAKRLNFCEWYLIMNEADPQFANNILWSDKAIFKMNGRVIRHNCVYWSDKNPHLIMQREVNAPGVMVWAGVSYHGVVGPYFFDTNVNAESYLELLVELRQTLNEDIRFEGHKMILQQDGAPAHFGIEVRTFLNENFPDWIRRGGRTAYPPRSPDLTLMDFSVWGIVKDRVFANNINNLDHLKELITYEFDLINGDPALLSQMVSANVQRYLKCIELDGKHFQHLL